MFIELRQLEYLVAVAEEASFTRAADGVHITQSGISAQIRQLERDLGATLLDRSARAATPTAAGAAALAPARAALAAAEAVRRVVDEVTGLIRGRLVVGMVRGLQALTILSEPVVAAVPLAHPLTRQPRVTLADVGAHPVICLPAGTGIRTVLDRACAAAGLHPTVALQASAPDAVADLAARGLGVAIPSASMTSDREDRLAAVRVDDLATPAALALTWALSDNPALRVLLEHARTAFPCARRMTRTTGQTKGPWISPWNSKGPGREVSGPGLWRC